MRTASSMSARQANPLYRRVTRAAAAVALVALTAGFVAAPAWAGAKLPTPKAPVVCNVDAAPCDDAERIRDLLRAQITAPVRWEECGRAVASASEVGVEVGSGRVLTGLMKRIDRAYPCHATGDVRQIVIRFGLWLRLQFVLTTP